MRPQIRALAALTAMLAAGAAAAATATQTRAWQYKPESSAGLEVRNLAGKVRVLPGSAAGFHVTVQASVEAPSQAEAERLLAAIRFLTRDEGGASAFLVHYPASEFPRIHHPQAPEGWWGGRMSVRYLGRQIRLSGDAGDAPTVNVDIVIRAPAGATLSVSSVFGDLVAEGYSGMLRLDGGRGLVRSTGGSGRLDLDGGSGRIEVDGHEGRLRADSGSGGIDITGCRCEMTLDTGSGPVRVRDSSGSLRADTGSGAVSIEGWSGPIRADTGSGAVRARGVSGLTALDVDTGSGAVSIDGDLSALERLRIDTGSGGVTLRSTVPPSLELAVETGSGHVNVDAPGTTVEQRRRGEQLIRIGSGAGRGVIDTGSGGVDIRVVSPEG